MLISKHVYLVVLGIYRIVLDTSTCVIQFNLFVSICSKYIINNCVICIISNPIYEDHSVNVYIAYYLLFYDVIMFDNCSRDACSFHIWPAVEYLSCSSEVVVCGLLRVYCEKWWKYQLYPHNFQDCKCNVFT